MRALSFRASDAGTGDIHESGGALAGDVTGDAVRGGCFSTRPRELVLVVRGGTCEGGDMVDGWPMEVTTDSSRLWKLDEVLVTEPMRWRPVTNAFGGDLSRVLFSSSVRPRGRTLPWSRPFLKA
jgi:hypothetical protein